MLENLKQAVYDTNKKLVSAGLVVLTWGNASAYDPHTNYVVIKPSGIDYQTMKPSDMVVVDLDGNVIEGNLNPSSDTPTHLALYRKWKEKVQAIIHTHSIHATAWAQSLTPIPCYGTTHADLFYGSIPITRILSINELADGYELHTATVILEAMNDKNPLIIPGILVANHGPFCWGKNLVKAFDAAVTLETVAEMAYKTIVINPKVEIIKKYIQDKHYFRKHGENAYYGQKIKK